MFDICARHRKYDEAHVHVCETYVGKQEAGRIGPVTKLLSAGADEETVAGKDKESKEGDGGEEATKKEEQQKEKERWRERRN